MESEPPGGESKIKSRNVTPEVSQEKSYTYVYYCTETKLYRSRLVDPLTVGPQRWGRLLHLGFYPTAYLAARAQDRAKLKYKADAKGPSEIKLNFSEEDYADDEELRKDLTNDQFCELLNRESQTFWRNNLERTPCLRKFWAEEVANGNMPDHPDVNIERTLSLKAYLDVLLNRVKMTDESMTEEEKMAVMVLREGAGARR